MKEYEIGKKLRKIREEAGISQADTVAELKQEGIHMSRETLSKVENYNRSISALELNALLNVYNSDIGEFFHKEETEDLVTFFRKKNFSENSLEEVAEIQDMVRLFARQEKIYKSGGNPDER